MSMPIQRQSEQFSVFDTGTRWARDNETRDLPKGLAGLVNSMGPRVGAGMLNTRTAAWGDSDPDLPPHLREVGLMPGGGVPRYRDEGSDDGCPGCGWNHDDDDKPMTDGCWDAIAGKGKKHEAGWHYPEYDPRVDGYPEEDLDRPTRAELDAEEYEDDEDRDYLRALDGQDPSRYIPGDQVDSREARLRTAGGYDDEYFPGLRDIEPSPEYMQKLQEHGVTPLGANYMGRELMDHYGLENPVRVRSLRTRALRDGWKPEHFEIAVMNRIERGKQAPGCAECEADGSQCGAHYNYGLNLTRGVLHEPGNNPFEQVEDEDGNVLSEPHYKSKNPVRRVVPPYVEPPADPHSPRGINDAVDEASENDDEFRQLARLAAHARRLAALHRAQAEPDEDEQWRTRERPDERFPEDEWGHPDHGKTGHEGRTGSRHPFELTAGWADDNPDFDDILNHIDEQLAAGEPEGLSDYFNEDYLDGPHPGTLPRPGGDHDGGCAHCGEQSTTDDDGYCDGCGHQHAPEELSPDAATHRRERYEGPPFAGATCDHCDTRHDEPFQVNDVSVGDDHKGAFCDDCVQDLLPSWYGHHTAASNDDVTDAVRKATGINLSMTDAGGGSYVFDGRLDDGSWIVASDSEGYQHGDMNERTEQEQQDEDEGWGGPLGWTVGVYPDGGEEGWFGQDAVHHHSDDGAYVHELPRVIQEALQTMPRGGRTAAVLFPPCPNCGQVKGFEPYPWARGMMWCNDRSCQHIVPAKDLAHEFNNLMLQHDLDVSTLPETDHPTRGKHGRLAEVAVDPAAMAPQMPAAGGYQPGHRVGLPWRGDVIRGTVIGLDGDSAAVRWDDGQYSSEEPHNIQLL